MTRDWQSVVCTTRRLQVSVLIALVSLVFIFLVLFWIEDLHFNELERKRESLKVGMTEQQLSQIMGKPAFSQMRDLEEVASFGFPPQGVPEEIKKHHKRFLEYGFITKRVPWSQAAMFVGGVYLDEDGKGIVWLGSTTTGVMDFFDMTIAKQLALLACFVIAVAIPLVGFRLWCKKNRNIFPINLSK
jgi:hypothetical protein